MNAACSTMLAVVCLVPVTGLAAAPERTMNNQKYHPEFMKLYAETRGFTLGRAAGVTLDPAGRVVLFLSAKPGTTALALHQMEVATGSVDLLLDPQTILAGADETLTVEEKARRERQRISVKGFTSFQLSRDGNTVLLPLSGALYALNRSTRAWKILPIPGGVVLDPQFSPDGSHLGYVRAGELCVLNLKTGKERVLTQGANALVSHGEAEFVAQEEMGRMHGFWWSPQGDALAYQETDNTALELCKKENDYIWCGGCSEGVAACIVASEVLVSAVRVKRDCHDKLLNQDHRLSTNEWFRSSIHKLSLSINLAWDIT